MLELAGVPLEIAGPAARAASSSWSCATSPRGGAPRPSASGCCARSALLAEASALFDQSLDEERTLRSVAELCVRDLADTCLVVLGGYPGPARRRSPWRATRRASRRSPPSRVLDGRTGDPVAEVLRTGARARRTSDARGRPAARARARARARSRRASTRSTPTDRDEALALLEDLGRRAALALDNARLYAERSAVAQHAAALAAPARPAADPGRAARRALPAPSGDGHRGRRRLLRLLRHRRRRLGAGDRRRLRQGRRGGGDHRARPLHAARLGAAQPAARAGARASSTRRCCARASTTASARSSTRRSRRARTAARSCSPRAGTRCRWSLRAGGAVETAGAPGTLLGIVREPEISEERVALAPGDALVLYTDGVVEASPADDALAPGAARGAAARAARGATRARSPRPSSTRRSRSRTAGCATTSRSSCCASGGRGAV